MNLGNLYLALNYKNHKKTNKLANKLCFSYRKKHFFKYFFENPLIFLAVFALSLIKTFI